MKNKVSRDEWIGMGLLIGVVFGAAIDNVGAGIAIGIALGVGGQLTKNKVSRDDR